MKLSEYHQIWCVDTEYVSQTGEHPSPVCFCAVELRTGEQQVVWLEEGVPSSPPIPLGSDVLYVTYSARAELIVHLLLGWPLPVNVLDLHVEHLLQTNGQRWENCKLSTLCRQLGFPAPVEEHKEAMRDRILKGPPFTTQERKAILEYCLQDAQMLLEPTRRMFNDLDLSQAVGARGEFMQVAARADHHGIPVDSEAYEALRRHVTSVWRRFVVELDRCGLYEDGHFHHSRLDQLVTKHNLPWPRTDKGNLHTDKETWTDMAEMAPELVGPYAELRRISSWLREGLDLQVGKDGRSRPNTFPFAQKAGRTSPSGSSIFAQPKWLRGLLKPESETSLFYADYSQQEPGLAGYLSGRPGVASLLPPSVWEFLRGVDD